jgi:hypothetical protein
MANKLTRFSMSGTRVWCNVENGCQFKKTAMKYITDFLGGSFVVLLILDPCIELKRTVL